MTLNEFLSALTTANATVIVKDLATGAEIITLKATGYASLDDALEARTIAQWSIANASQIVVLLNGAETNENVGD